MTKKQLSWPEFWPEFGNKFPLKSTSAHDIHFIFQVRGHLCFYCALEVMADKLMFSNKGVTTIIPESGLTDGHYGPICP